MNATTARFNIYPLAARCLDSIEPPILTFSSLVSAIDNPRGKAKRDVDRIKEFIKATVKEIESAQPSKKLGICYANNPGWQEKPIAAPFGDRLRWRGSPPK